MYRNRLYRKRCRPEWKIQKRVQPKMTLKETPTPAMVRRNVRMTGTRKTSLVWDLTQLHWVIGNPVTLRHDSKLQLVIQSKNLTAHTNNLNETPCGWSPVCYRRVPGFIPGQTAWNWRSLGARTDFSSSATVVPFQPFLECPLLIHL